MVLITSRLSALEEQTDYQTNLGEANIAIFTLR